MSKTSTANIEVVEQNKVVSWTMNPAAVRFLFEDAFSISLSIDKPYLEPSEEMLANPRFQAYVAKAVSDNVLYEGLLDVNFKKNELGESPIKPAKILHEGSSMTSVKNELREICSRTFRYLSDGKIRTASNDIAILKDYEKQYLNRPQILNLLDQAKQAIDYRDKGGISPIEETPEKTSVTGGIQQMQQPRQSETPVGGSNPIDEFFSSK